MLNISEGLLPSIRVKVTNFFQSGSQSLATPEAATSDLSPSVGQ
ncbi:hypothetical protein [Runella aurantiaca]|nr:hypothetical protein [Runella aurantiaca]